MAKTPKRTSTTSYRSVGTTYDGVTILKPKTRPTQFTTRQIRTAIAQVLRDGAGAGVARKRDVYVEPRDAGDFAVRRQGANRASDVLPTQKDAIERALDLAPDKAPVVRRVRNAKGGKAGQWRKS